MSRKISKIATPVKVTRNLETKYRKELNRFATALIRAVNKQLLAFLKLNEHEYVLDSFSSQLEFLFNQLNQTFTGAITLSFAESTAKNIVEQIDKSSLRKFTNSIEQVTGIDPSGFIKTENLGGFIETSINKNVSLIKSLPEEYLRSVETIISNGVTSGARYSTIAQEITSLVGSANSKLKNRIKTIARNETATIMSQINLRRNTALGVTKGIFRTSRDEKVRPCHRELDGVEYELSKGAWSKSCNKYIQPGITDINCRCTFSPVIEV